MRSSTLLLFTALVTLIACGCNSTDSTPVDPGTYAGVNGFTINGGEFKNTTINFAKASVEFLDERGDQLAIRLDEASLGDQPITLVLALPHTNLSATDYSWADADDFGPDVAYSSIEGEEETLYRSRSGHTIVTSAAAKGGIVTGTFSGTIENADDTQTYTINGKFSATRIN